MGHFVEGTTLAGRFVLGAPLGAGGMGQVFRAVDRRSGLTVAVKVMLQADQRAPHAARFAAEIGVLSELHHPGIVGYVAHGETDDGLPFLAMEYLEGEDLAGRLDRGQLSVSEALLLITRVASALDEAHRRGIVHRDLKPSNIFLRDGDPARVAVLDFGIARRVGGARAVTQTGVIIGTPEYMAPEQAQGSRAVGPPADVFALGCVLYHCLTGQPPFVADHVVATLGKILFGEPHPLEQLCPDVPGRVRALVAKMLEKQPSDRFPDAGALVAALHAQLPLGEGAGAGARSNTGLGARELELVSVIVVSQPRAEGDDATIDAASVLGADGGATAVLRVLAARSVPSERLADGSIVATLGQGGGSASDQALQAASVAQLVHGAWPQALIAVATARRIAGAKLPVGEALDRAARLLAASGTASVRLDDVTAGLLDGRVHTMEVAGLRTLDDEHALVDATRPLLGKPTPCVGREQELSILELTMASSFDEGSSRAVLVVAPAGLGKSRLRHELLRRVAARSQGEAPPVLVLEARGELLRAASPLGLAAQALRRLFEVGGADDGVVGRAKILAGVERWLPGPAAVPVAELLGELCDVPFPDNASVRLRAARQDSRVMQARIGEAFVALLRAATTTHGVLVVLEDLHWGDRASMSLVELALRELDDRPVFAVAFARPEIDELAPELWRGRVTRIPLRPLARRACERLIAGVAGDRLDHATIARIAEQSDGNALFLEELVRAACHGDGAALPETVLAMLQARIGWLDANVRRVLRAASVFGESFTLGGLVEVLGVTDTDSVGTWLEELTREEIVEPQRDAPGAFRFRHALMRDASYGLLTDDDRRLGHRLAAGWLATRDDDPTPIAEHLLLAGDARAAAPWFVRAAQRAHDRDDYGACERLARRGRAAGAEGEPLGALGALQSYAAILRWDWQTADAVTRDALVHLPPGSRYWCHAQRTVAQLAAYRNDPARLRSCVEGYLTTDAHEDARVGYADAALHIASSATQAGLPRLGRALLERVESHTGDLFPRYPMLLAWFHVIRCTLHRHTDDDLAPQLRRLREALRLYEDAGAPRSMLVLAADVLGEVECRAGQLDEGEARLRHSCAVALALGVGLPASHARLALANGLLARHQPASTVEAARLAEQILETPGISAGYQAMARDVLAEALEEQRDHVAAEREARAAIALSPHTPVRRWQMVAHLVRALLGAGRATEGHETASEALREMDAAGTGGGYAELPLLLAAVAAAREAGHVDEALILARRTEERCARQAAAFEDPGARSRFLEHIARITRPLP